MLRSIFQSEAQPQQLIVMTPAMLEDLANRMVSAMMERIDALRDESEEYVFGIHGIEQLFNVGRTKAQELKNTILAPACVQNGRTIVVDVKLARRLFNEGRSNDKSK